MKVENMTSSKGNTVPNQFIISGHTALGEPTEAFQSHKSIIAMKTYTDSGVLTVLDSTYWDYSATADKYRNQFLGESKAETQKKIDSGEYILAELN